MTPIIFCVIVFEKTEYNTVIKFDLYDIIETI